MAVLIKLRCIYCVYYYERRISVAAPVFKVARYSESVEWMTTTMTVTQPQRGGAEQSALAYCWKRESLERRSVVYKSCARAMPFASAKLLAFVGDAIQHVHLYISYTQAAEGGEEWSGTRRETTISGMMWGSVRVGLTLARSCNLLPVFAFKPNITVSGWKESPDARCGFRSSSSGRQACSTSRLSPPS